MRNNNPILIVEDDEDDCELLKSTMKELGIENEQIYFKNGEEALRYLRTTDKQTFIIISDDNMPRVNGLTLKEEINKDEKLRIQSIPFVFLSTSAAKTEVEKAYELTVQGFFKKRIKPEEIKNMLKLILDYWDICEHPNTVK